MGAQDFYIRQRASSAKEAFTLAVETAITEYGNDIYNGTVSTCHGYNDVTEMYKRGSLNKKEFINGLLYRASKRDCFIIEEKAPVKNDNKIKTTVYHNFVRGTSKWELRYNVYTGWEDHQLKSFRTKGDAVKFAREHTEKTKDTTFVRMEKKLIDQDPNVATIKYKHSTQETEGEYVIFGIAAC